MSEYRYTLRRNLGLNPWRVANESALLWIMLNPSTADDTTDDPTIRRVISADGSVVLFGDAYRPATPPLTPGTAVGVRLDPRGYLLTRPVEKLQREAAALPAAAEQAPARKSNAREIVHSVAEGHGSVTGTTVEVLNGGDAETTCSPFAPTY